MSQDSHEEFKPVLDPEKEYEEINGYVVFWGLFYAALFALAVGYLCLKIGQTVDAFAPISVLAMGMGMMLKRKNSFIETVHIQAIGSAGTNILGGAMFILPAFFLLRLEHITFFQMCVPIVLGGLFGVLVDSLFRQYFCSEMHDVYPFPAGRAAAEVLTSSGSGNAKLMVISGVVAAAYDFVLNSLGWWQEVISTTTFQWGQAFEDKFKMGFSLDNDAALLGIGYFTGLRYAAIIAAGSFFSMYVITPVVYYLGGDHVMIVNGKEMLLSNAPVRQVFLDYVRHIGIGMLAMAGVIGLLSMSKVVAGVVKKAIFGMISSNAKVQVKVLRTEKDLSSTLVVAVSLLITLAFTAFIHFNFSQNIIQTVAVFFISLILAFLLSVVGISSIAFTGNEPVSGMTIFMILFSAVILSALGMSGEIGMATILMMAGFIASTIGVAGNFMSEMKVAHLTGVTPKKMQQWQLASVAISAVIAVVVLFLLNNAYGFTGEGALNAPQANAMAAIVQPLMSGTPAQWTLYVAGAVFAVILWMCQVPPLVFALGTFLPMSINTPVLVGGILAYLVQHSSKDEILANIRYERGSTIASGFVAGGAIGALFSAVLRVCGINMFMDKWVETPAATYLGILMYALLFAFCYFVAVKIKEVKNTEKA